MKNWKQSFYLSKAWRNLRAVIINRDNGICQICKKFVRGVPEIDHIIELTEDNYTNPEISLNPKLLRTLCNECHNARHKRFGGQIKKTIVDDELNIDYKRR